MTSGSVYRRTLVAKQFHSARRRAAVESLLARFSGQSSDLLSFAEVVEKLEIRGQTSLGLQHIPVSAIVGSVGRYQDFTRTFLPRLESDEDRWVGVGAAAANVTDLPPIELYKVGESYFVLDGNHRVSLARLQGVAYLDALVIEVRTRAPLPPGANPDDVIIAAEQASFLQYTNLDTLYPDVDIRVSVPGQYNHLENYIEAYRFVLETSEGREIPYDEAITLWFENVYLPLVEAIREQGILRYFPGRTETDFFIWLTRHRVALQNELGYTLSPDVAVSRLLPRVNVAAQEPQPLFTRLRRLAHLVPPEHIKLPTQTWAEERKLNRYSDCLFGHILFPIAVANEINNDQMDKAALKLAQEMAAKENAHLCGLFIKIQSPSMAAQEVAVERLSNQILRDKSPQKRTEILVEIGDATQRTLDLAYLHDLIVLERGFNHQSPNESVLSPAVRDIISKGTQPLFIFGATDNESVPNRVLLVHDTRRRFDEALFIAAYLAEQWKVELAVLPISNGRNTEEVVARVREYLELHEINALYLDAIRLTNEPSEVIVDAALTTSCDLILLSGPGRGVKGRRNQATETIWSILKCWPQPVLIGT